MRVSALYAEVLCTEVLGPGGLSIEVLGTGVLSTEGRAETYG